MTVCGIKHADGVCVMGECPHIKTCCPVVWDKSGKPLTNEEWIKSMNTEQLAEWLNNKIIICAVCDQQKICGYFINETCHLCPYHEGKNKSWEVWLKQPH